MISTIQIMYFPIVGSNKMCFVHRTMYYFNTRSFILHIKRCVFSTKGCTIIKRLEGITFDTSYKNDNSNNLLLKRSINLLCKGTTKLLLSHSSKFKSKLCALYNQMSLFIQTRQHVLLMSSTKVCFQIYFSS